MNYKQAIAAANKVGASKATGLPLLAITISSYALAHAIPAEMTYDAAVRQGLDAAAIHKMVRNDLPTFSFLAFS